MWLHNFICNFFLHLFQHIGYYMLCYVSRFNTQILRSADGLYLLFCMDLRKKKKIFPYTTLTDGRWLLRGTKLIFIYNSGYRSQWPRGLRRRSAAARLLGWWVRIPPGAWIFVCCECCVLSGRGLCAELITRPEESYLFLYVVVCDLGTSRMRRPWPALGRHRKKTLSWW